MQNTNIKKINISVISDAVETLCIESNCYLNDDITRSLNENLGLEPSLIGRNIIEQLIENADISRSCKTPICQDTGMAVVFVEVGQNVYIEGGSLTEAITQGVRDGYKKGFLRTSVVSDPIERKNTGDNTPPIIHYDILEGDALKITVMPKGFGSENMSAVKMLKPSDGIEGIKSFILETVKSAGPNPCPPIIVGVGIGGTMEKAAIISKKALLRPIDKYSILPHIKELEIELLESINMLGIGPAGLGGRLTALGINIEVFPTHIAGLPVAVNISCHVTRHACVTL